MARITGRPRANRFMAGLPACLSVNGREISCTAHDLSRSGVLLRGEIPPFSEDEISLTIRHPGGDLQFTTPGRVIRWDETPDDRTSVLGVEFLGLHPGKEPALEALIARVVEGASPAILETLSEGATHDEIRRVLEQVPLAHRTALAARARPKEREILIHDSQPSVLDGLARNPSLLPHELVTLLRMPNLPPQTLDTLAKETRWSGNQQITVMIATHRNTPLGTAERMVGKMPPAWLERVIQASSLKAPLRALVLRRLKR